MPTSHPLCVFLTSGSDWFQGQIEAVFFVWRHFFCSNFLLGVCMNEPNKRKLKEPFATYKDAKKANFISHIRLNILPSFPRFLQNFAVKLIDGLSRLTVVHIIYGKFSRRFGQNEETIRQKKKESKRIFRSLNFIFFRLKPKTENESFHF